MHIQDAIMKLVESDPDYIIGFADVGGFLSGELSMYQYAISIGKKLHNKTIDEIEYGPTEQYYNVYRETNEELAEMVAKISTMLNFEGVENVSVKPTMEDNELDEEYIRTLRTSFSHKFAATRSGLGWIGKTDLLISNKFGPRLRLSSLLIRKGGCEFKVGEPIIKSKCGTCNICVEKCPAKAANGRLWSIDTDRDEFYDAHKCRTKSRELSKAILNRNESICGICISVCPIGKNK